MFEDSPLNDRSCQPLLAYCGRKAELTLHPASMFHFHGLNFNNLNSLFSYDIKISRFESRIFSGDLDAKFAFMVESKVKSNDLFEAPFTDANVFLEKDFNDLIEYCIILPRMFKRHHRYVLNMEKDSVCSFGDFADKVEAWKRSTGIM